MQTFFFTLWGIKNHFTNCRQESANPRGSLRLLLTYSSDILFSIIPHIIVGKKIALAYVNEEIE